MERKIYLLKRATIVILLILSRIAISQVDCNKEIYQAFINGRMDLWEQHIKKMEQNYIENKRLDCLYDLTFAQYGLIAYLISVRDNEKGKNYLEKAEKNVEMLLSEGFQSAEIYSLKGALFGFKIGFNKFLAVTYGPQSIDLINKAFDIDKENPKVWMEKANITYYIPSTFGGGVDNAILFQEKAVELFENDPHNLKYNWIYLLVMTNLAQWYDEINSLEKAKLLYKKILAFEPEYKWVKNELYPELIQKIKKD